MKREVRIVFSLSLIWPTRHTKEKQITMKREKDKECVKSQINIGKAFDIQVAVFLLDRWVNPFFFFLPK